jgi:hypothetical protein
MVFLLLRSGTRHLTDEEANLLGYTRCVTPDTEADMEMLQR